MSKLKAGSILVANPQMMDPSFARTVNLLVVYDDQGVVGVNIAATPVQGKLCRGGPLQGFAFVLHKQDDSVADSIALGETGFGVTSLSGSPDAPEPADVIDQPTSMALVGYAGWNTAQLAEEIEAGAWGVAEIALEELMSLPAEERYERACREAFD